MATFSADGDQRQERGPRDRDGDGREYREYREREPREKPDKMDFSDPLEVSVREDVDRAMKELKKRVSKEGILKELKLRRYYEKPSEKKKRKTKEAEKRRRKQARRKVRRQRILEHKIRSL